MASIEVKSGRTYAKQSIARSFLCSFVVITCFHRFCVLLLLLHVLFLLAKYLSTSTSLPIQSLAVYLKR